MAESIWLSRINVGELMAQCIWLSRINIGVCVCVR